MTENVAQTTERLCGRIRMLEEQLEELGNGKKEERLSLEIDKLKTDRHMLVQFISNLDMLGAISLPQEIRRIMAEDKQAA